MGDGSSTASRDPVRGLAAAISALTCMPTPSAISSRSPATRQVRKPKFGDHCFPLRNAA